ncbi:MAG: Nif3-like dinuclear metal center hexameric protein [Alcaligenaceae bacterium]|nr:Nif3-like dinuclear metal center hexameric protein [Alcaligenaceae bacterium]
MNKITVKELINWLDNQLQPHLFQDYAPNGLQVQGKPEINKVIFGVTASLALVEQAIEKQADAIIVHHGWFWKNEDTRITNAKYQRLAKLIKHDINLIGYHLPLDAHTQWGNNVMLAQVLGLRVNYVDNKPQTFGRDDLIWLGQPPAGVSSAADFASAIEKSLGRRPLFIGDPDQKIETVAWCTGGAQGMFEEAVLAGADAYITGEASEPVYHLAHEYGVAYYGAGHHATERYGVQGLMKAMQAKFSGLILEYVDIDNPI